MGPVTFGMVYQGRRQKKKYPAVKIHPGKFEDEPGKFWLVSEKFLRFVLKFSRMYFYGRINFFLTAMLQRMPFFFAEEGLTPMVPMYLSGRVTGF